MGGGVRLRCSCPLLAPMLRLNVELAEEELSSSPKLKSLLSLARSLPSLSIDWLLPRCPSPLSISTVIMGGGVCFEVAGGVEMLAAWAYVALAAG